MQMILLAEPYETPEFFEAEDWDDTGGLRRRSPEIGETIREKKREGEGGGQSQVSLREFVWSMIFGYADPARCELGTVLFRSRALSRVHRVRRRVWTIDRRTHRRIKMRYQSGRRDKGETPASERARVRGQMRKYNSVVRYVLLSCRPVCAFALFFFILPSHKGEIRIKRHDT